MQGKSIVVLFLLVGALGALVWMQQEEAAADPDGFIDFAVFEDIAVDNIHSIQVEQIERHWNMRLECDARANWYLTEPIAYRAAQGQVSSLLEQIEQLRGIEVLNIEDAGGLGFDPPRAVLTVTERTPDSAAPGETSVQPRSVVVEIGGTDLDGNTLYVRVDGRILRTVRTLYNAINGTDQDFRSRRLTEISPLERSIELSRQGSYAADGEDLSFEALSEKARWFATSPARVSLDPTAIALFHQQIVGSHIAGFHDDHPEDLALYGLDEPLLRLEFRTSRGNSVALLFARSPDEEEVWLGMREGHPFVWRISARDVSFFCTAFDQLYDYAFVRANRSDIESILLESEVGALRLIHTGAEWVVTGAIEVADADLSEDQYVRADEGKIGDLLGALDHAELAVFLDRGVNFDPGLKRQRFEIKTRSGLVFGGEIGAAHQVSGGEEGLMFMRRDDELVSIIPKELAKSLQLSLDELRSLEVHKLVEREQHAVRLRRGGDELVYVLDRKANVWQTEGTTLEAKGFAGLIDRLLSMRVRRWLSTAELPGSTEGAITVEIQSVTGVPLVVRVLRSPDGQELCEKDGLWGEIRPGLAEALAGLFDS